MKDIPHHVQKLNRKVLREVRREQEGDLPEIPQPQKSLARQKKEKKRAMRKKGEEHIPLGKSPEERNREMRSGRVPIFYDKNHQKPKRSSS